MDINIALNDDPQLNYKQKIQRAVDYNHPAEKVFRGASARKAAGAAGEIQYERREVTEGEETYVVEDREDGAYIVAKQGKGSPVKMYGDNGLKLDQVPESAMDQGIFNRIGDIAKTTLQTGEGALRGIGIGETKFVTNVLRSAIDNPIGDYAIGAENVQAFEDFSKEFLSNLDKASKKSITGEDMPPAAEIAQSIGDVSGQYIMPAAGLYKTFRAMNAGPLLSSILADGTVGFFGVSPENENLANLIPEDSKAFGALRELIATDPEDGEFKNRARNAIEAMGVLGLTEAATRGIIGAVKAGKSAIKAIEMPEGVGKIMDHFIVGAGAAGALAPNAAYGNDAPQIEAFQQRYGFTQLEQKHGLPPGLMSAVMWTESRGNARAVSPAGAKGLFQFMPDTAKELGIDPLNPAQSTKGAAQYLARLYKKYDGNLEKTLAAYNWGMGNVDRKGLEKAPKETRDYVKKITGLLGVEVAAAGDMGFQLLADQMANPNMQLASARTDLVLKAGKLITKEGEQIIPDEVVARARGALEQTGKVEGIDFNLSRMETTEQLDHFINEVSEIYKEPINKIKGGVQTFDETQAKADLSRMTGFDVEEVLSRQQGDLWPAHKIKAARDIFVAELNKTDEIARSIKAGDDSSETLIKFRRQLSVVSGLQSQIKGVQTETARALSQYRMTAKSPMEYQVNIAEMLQKSGGQDMNNALVDAYMNAMENGGPDAAARFARNAEQISGWDMLYEAWINSLLGSPATHAVNALGNTMTMKQSVLERYAAATYGSAARGVDRMLGGTGNKGVTFAEAHAYAQGLAMSTNDAMVAFMKALKSGESSDLFGKMGYNTAAITTQNVNELPISKTIASKMLNKDELIQSNSQLAHMIDFMGEYYYRLPGRFLMAEDDLFKTMNYRGQLHALAAREAFETGASAEEAHARLMQILDDPALNAPAIHQEALNFAREQTFTTPPGQAAQMLSGFLSNANIGNFPAGRVVVPFFNVVNNITKYVGGRVPGLGLINPNSKTYKDFFSNDPATRQLVMGKWATGGSLLGFGAWANMNGVCTGRMTDNPAMLKQIETTQKKKRYSCQLPGTDKTFEYNRLDPAGMLMAIAADTSTALAYVDNEEERENLVLAATAAVVPYMEDKSFMSGIANFFEAFNPQNGGDDARIRALSRYFADLGASAPGAIMGPLAPNTPLTNNLKRNVFGDTTKRVPEASFYRVEKDSYGDDVLIANSESYRFWERMLNKIYAGSPGLSKDIPADLNIWGEEIRYEGGLGPDLVTPIYTNTPAYKVSDLKGHGFPPQIEAGRFFNMRVGSDLTLNQHRQFVDIVGIDGELERLNMPLQSPQKQISARINGKNFGLPVKLNQAEYNDLIKIMNEIRVPNNADPEKKRMNLKETLNWMIKQPEYAKLPDDRDATGAKGDMIRKIYNDYKGAAIELFFQEHPKGQLYFRKSVEMKQKAQNTGVQ